MLSKLVKLCSWSSLTIFRWLLMSVMLIIAINLKNPHLLAYRQYETAFLLIFPVFGIAVYLRRHRNLERLIAINLLSVILMLTLYGEFIFQYRKKVVLNTDQLIARQLGEHFVVGYDKQDEIQTLIRKGLVGGIFITQHNAAGKSFNDLSKEIRELQALKKETGLQKLIVATDQEGGIVSRLSPPLNQQPALAALADGQYTTAELLSKAEAYGKQQGYALANLGVTVNFSPVVDLKSDRTDDPLDFHSLINQRAISIQPALTAEVAQAYVRGLESQGVNATLKHFPGLGHVADDAHHFSAKLDMPLSELDTHDWIPFKQIAEHSNALIMLGQ